MENWEPLNMGLRAWVISRVLRLEQSSSSAIKSMLRMFNENSKTLGNQSSALSFKAKIDLLFDLEEITKIEYSHLLKLMEIRNQFAHNHEAVSFESLDAINPDINKYLLKNQSDKIDKSQPKEVILKAVFDELFVMTAGKLLIIDLEFTKGIQKEMRRHVNDLIVEQFEVIWQEAVKKHKDSNTKSSVPLFYSEYDPDLTVFYYDLRLAMSDFAQKELGTIEGDKIKAVLKQKETMQESFKKNRERKKSENKE